MDKNKPTLTGKVKRYANVSRKITGATARIAGNKIIGSNNLDKNADIILNALGGLKGPLMKVAQLLSTIPDALPKEYAEKLQSLQAEAPSMGWFFVKRRMSSELGSDWLSKFDSFERVAKNPASLGQDHKAKINANEIACKLQYPDMISTVDADLKQLKLIFSLYGTWDKTIKTKDIYNELSERLKEELNYKRELKNMLLFNEMLKDEKYINIPKPIDKLSTNRLLTMSWLNGESFMKWKNSSPNIKNHLALTLFYAWYIPFYKFGIIHGDPHPGNYQVDNSNADKPKINLLDFGCIRVFPAKFVRGVIDLYIAMRDNNQKLAINAYKSWGFNNLSKDLIKVLNIWALYIYGPLLENKKRQIQDPNADQNGKEVASNVYKELKKLGGVSPPKEFVLIDRAAVGLGSVFMHLNAELNWHKIIEELISNFDEKELHNRQKDIIKKFKIK